MDTTTSNTQTPPPTHTTPLGSRKSKTPKVLIGLLVGIVVLAIGVAGGYFYGMMEKDIAVQQAKLDAENAAQAEISKAHESAGQKTETNTTCNADELSLSLEAADAAAGTYSYNLIFTNTSDRTCTLYGYPGVSLVNDNGNMVGSPAERTENAEEIDMTLEPQGRVKSILYAANSDNFSDGQCSEGATKLRVYPPNDAGYISVATDANLTNWCPGFEVSPVMGV